MRQSKALTLLSILTATQAACGGDEIAAVDNFCPVALEFETIGELSRIDVGWNGMSHGERFPKGTGFAVEVYNCDEECRLCRLPWSRRQQR